MRIDRHRMLSHLDALLRFDDEDAEPPSDPQLDAVLFATMQSLSAREARDVDDLLIAGYIDDRLEEAERLEAERLFADHPHLIEELLVLEDVAQAMDAAARPGGAGGLDVVAPIAPTLQGSTPAPRAANEPPSRVVAVRRRVEAAVVGLAALIPLGLGVALRAPPLAAPQLLAMHQVLETGTRTRGPGVGVYPIGSELSSRVDPAGARSIAAVVIEARSGEAPVVRLAAGPVDLATADRGEDGNVVLTTEVAGQPGRQALVLATSRHGLEDLPRWLDAWQPEAALRTIPEMHELLALDLGNTPMQGVLSLPRPFEVATAY